MRFSLGSGFLYINKHVCKQICPVWLQGRKDWIHAPVEAPFMWPERTVPYYIPADLGKIAPSIMLFCRS